MTPMFLLADDDLVLPTDWCRPAKTVSSPPKAMPGPITYVGPEPTKAAPSLDDLTIAEARALYLKLHKMFG